MAIITHINGAATTGTVGINNIFGSGGGGGTPSPTPTFTIGRSTTYTGNSVTVTNTSAYTDPSFRITVTDSASTVVATIDDCTITTQSGNKVISWDDSGLLGTHTIELYAQEFGDYFDSAAAIDTYTVAAAQFKYWRIYGADSSGNPTTGSNKYIHLDEWDLYEGQAQTGQVHPNVTLTSNTSSADYVASRGHTQYNYPAYQAFDGLTNTQVWTLAASAANNWCQLEFKQATVPSISSMTVNHGSQMAQNVTWIKIVASNTGAFAGEEITWAHYEIATTGYTKNIG